MDSSNITYRFLGPTVAHLRHEFSLLICLSLLTMSSLLSLYRYSFGTSGDWHLILLTTFWLGRHLLFRILCTNDVVSLLSSSLSSSSDFAAAPSMSVALSSSSSSSSSWMKAILTAGRRYYSLLCVWTATIIMLPLSCLGAVLARCCSAGQFFDQPVMSKYADVHRIYVSRVMNSYLSLKDAYHHTTWVVKNAVFNPTVGFWKAVEYYTHVRNNSWFGGGGSVGNNFGGGSKMHPCLGGDAGGGNSVREAFGGGGGGDGGGGGGGRVFSSSWGPMSSSSSVGDGGGMQESTTSMGLGFYFTSNMGGGGGVIGHGSGGSGGHHHHAGSHGHSSGGGSGGSVGGGGGSSVSSIGVSTSQTSSPALYRNLEKYWDYVPPLQLIVAVIVGICCLVGILNVYSGIASYGTAAGNNAAAAQAAIQNYNFVKNKKAQQQQQQQQQNQQQQQQQQPSMTGANLATQQNVPGQVIGGGTGVLGGSGPSGLAHGGVDQFVGGVAWSGTSDEGGSGSSSGGSGGGGAGAAVGPFGAEPPSVWRYWIFLCCVGTLLSLITYGRVLLPLPDLTGLSSFGSSLAGGGGSGGGGGSRSGNVAKTGVKESKQKASKHNSKRDINLPWAEQYKSINQENRFRLYCKLIWIRVLENVFACAYLPQTAFACKVTKHCEAGPVIWGRRGAHLGILSAERVAGGGTSVVSVMFDSIHVDYLARTVIAVTVAIVTVILSVAQMALLDKSRLAATSYMEMGGFFGGGARISSFYADGGRVPGAGAGGGSSGTGPLVSSSSSRGGGGGGKHPHSGSTSRGKRNRKGGGGGGGGGGGAGDSHGVLASSAAAAGEEGGDALVGGKHYPFDACAYLRASAFEMFQYELGHPTTSSVVSALTKVHLGHVFFVLGVCVFYFVMGYGCAGMTVTLVADLVACHATSTIGIMDYMELQSLAKEINSAHAGKMKKVR